MAEFFRNLWQWLVIFAAYELVPKFATTRADFAAKSFDAVMYPKDLRKGARFNFQQLR